MTQDTLHAYVALSLMTGVHAKEAGTPRAVYSAEQVSGRWTTTSVAQLPHRPGDRRQRLAEALQSIPVNVIENAVPHAR